MNAESFYDGLAEDYHLVYADWHESRRRQAGVLAQVIEEVLGDGPHRIFDCTCGIGTQALGLAELGHEVVGADLSPRATERARREADKLGVSVRFHTLDVTKLRQAFDAQFDVVLSGDNSLPHLLSDADLLQALRGMLAVTRSGGLLLLSIRDYDRLLEERPGATSVAVNGPTGSRWATFQVWDWDDDGRTYETELFVLKEGAKGWSAQSYRTAYRAIVREELSALVRDVGFSQPRWLMPDETGFFQPLMVAEKR